MADSFGDLNLFAEFERTPEPADKILMSKYNTEFKKDFTDNADTTEETDDSEEGGIEHNFLDSSQYQKQGGAEIAVGKNPSIESGRRSCSKDNLNQTSSDRSSAAVIAKLKAELAKIRKDNERLRRHSRLISTSKCGKLDEGPVVQLIYMNNHMSRKCKDLLEAVVSQFIYDNLHKDVSKYQEKYTTPSSFCLDEDEEDTPVPEEKIRQIKTSTVIGCSQMYRQFIIDTIGWPLIDNNPLASEGWEPPKYKQVFSISLGDVEDEKENSCPQKIRRFCCFNCDGDHNMKNCKEPYNSAKVAQNRQKFRNETQGLQKQNSRYHVNDPKFSKFKPGQISDELRQALGLADDQLPVYIYNMRKLGYPPGYQQALTDDCSGIAMFGKDGREISLSGEPAEEGEVDAAIPVNYVTKIIEYPGFNVPVKNGIKDESKMLGKTAFSSRQSKETMAEQLIQKNRGIKRRSYGEDVPSIKRKKEENTPADMEIDTGNSPASPINSDNLTLDELQQQKAMIKKLLALSEGGDADIEVLDSYEESLAPPLSPTPIHPPLPNSTPPVTPQTSTSRQECLYSSNGTPVLETPEGSHHLRTPSSGGSLSMSLGTPVIDNSNGKRVPEPEKFSKGIQQDIPFENLPGATGTFERVKRVLSHLRSLEDSSS